MSLIPPGAFPDELFAMRTREDLLGGIERMQGDTTAFFQGMEPAAYFARPATGWSPEQNLGHLIKSIRPVRLALYLPRFTFVIFGRGTPTDGPRDVIEKYLGVLGQGYRAGLPYRPGGGHSTRDDVAQPSPTALRAWDRQLRVYADYCDGLRESLTSWNEADLDRYRMPHPATGMISAREMLYFTVFHPYHHMARIRARRE